ncbi:hypothetical protein F5148DRAFT_1152219 [Russula earlei]|uniref:Uncharacterized protein n=1 Tax=Russula earlei TaxID=71964 RepID=A0ACC0TYY2_9AGAM|nr:hypothetical protein F5148DRAFT_1152219 [Russula earlei]
MSESLSKSFSNLKVTAPHMKVQIALLKHSEDNRILFYSFDVGTEWYIKYTNMHRKELKDFDNLTKISAGIRLLRAHTGIKGLKLNNEGPSYRRCPSQEQLDQLVQIMGRQPRWWVDYDDPRSYEYE